MAAKRTRPRAQKHLIKERPYSETPNTSQAIIRDVSFPAYFTLPAEKEGFVVVGKIEGRTWSKEDAEAFYSEHSGKPFFDTLVAFMTSGPIVQLCLEKVPRALRPAYPIT